VELISALERGAKQASASANASNAPRAMGRARGSRARLEALQSQLEEVRLLCRYRFCGVEKGSLLIRFDVETLDALK